MTTTGDAGRASAEGTGADAGEGADPVPDLLGSLHGFVWMALDPATHRELGARAGVPVGWLELYLLRTIRILGSPTVREAAQDARQAEPEALRMVQVLQHRGFVVRRPDRHDRRILRLHVTTAGAEADDARARSLDLLAREVIAEWAPQDVGVFAVLLRRYAGDLHRLLHPTPPAGDDRRAADRPRGLTT